MDNQEVDFNIESDEDDTETYGQLEELEKLETIILLMEELGLSTLEETRTRFTVLEKSIDADD